MNTKSEDIIKLLSKKHCNDVFVTECKTGNSLKGCARLDAWVMNKSWSNNVCIGYEVKVSRSDYLCDKKYRQYLKYCNEFYFVCPDGVIDKSEVDGDVGLITVSKTGNRLFTRKKSKFREVIIQENIFKYILMYRTNITESNFNENNKNCCGEPYWADWIKNKKSNNLLGKSVSKKLRERVSEEIHKVECENLLLKSQNKSLESVKKELKNLGIDSEKLNEWSIKSRLNKIKNIIPDSFINDIESFIKKSEIVLKEFKKLNEN